MKLFLITLFYFTLFSNAIGQNIPSQGQWQGVVGYEQGDVPFEFKVEHKKNKIILTIINGVEKIRIDKVELEGDSIIVSLVPFDAEIRAKFDAHSMVGYWKKGYKTGTIPFHASYRKPRYEGGDKKKMLSYKWQLELERGVNDTYPAVGLFHFQNGIASGSILSEVGDYRFFEGVIRNDSLIMSSFDGVHGFEIRAKINSGNLNGLFHFDNGYSEKITGLADVNAEIVAPFKQIDSKYRPYFNILSAGNPNEVIDETKYFDKVLILQLFGTWCPNSKDQVEFLKEWYGTKPENVEVLAVTYEPNFSTEYGLERIQNYKQEMNIPYDIMLGGELSKGQAALALPYLEKINAFPTLILIDKYGFIRYHFDYFNGPATGEYYSNFKKEFLTAIDKLSAE